MSDYPAQAYSERLDAVDAALKVVGNSFQPGFSNNTNGAQEFSVLRDNGDGYAGFRFRSSSTANGLPTLSMLGSAEEFTIGQDASTFRLDRFGVQLGAGSTSLNLTNSGIGITGNITMPSGSVLTTGAAGAGTFTINNDGNSRWQFIANEFSASGIIRPATTNLRSLGTSSFRWSTVFGVNGDFSGNITASGTGSFAGNVTTGSQCTFGTSTGRGYYNTSFGLVIPSNLVLGASSNVDAGAAAYDASISRAGPGLWQFGTTGPNAAGSVNFTNATASGNAVFGSGSSFPIGIGQDAGRGGYLASTVAGTTYGLSFSSANSIFPCSGTAPVTNIVSLGRADYQFLNVFSQNLNAVAATIANNATRSSNLVSMSSAFNIGNGNSVLSIGYTGADMGRALSVSSSSYTTGAMTITQTTGAAASNTNVSGLTVTGTFLHTDAGGATSIGNGGRFVATNTTASSGTLFGLDVSATTNAANVTGLRVTAATTSGTALAIDAVGSIQTSGTLGWSDVRMPRVVKTLQTQCFESSLAAWQETSRQEASATGARWSCLGATPIVRQTLPAAATDAATTQALANSIRSLLINFGFAN